MAFSWRKFMAKYFKTVVVFAMLLFTSASMAANPVISLDGKVAMELYSSISKEKIQCDNWAEYPTYCQATISENARCTKEQHKNATMPSYTCSLVLTNADSAQVTLDGGQLNLSGK
jgi:hypothetical protein